MDSSPILSCEIYLELNYAIESYQLQGWLWDLGQANQNFLLGLSFEMNPRK